MRSSFSIPYIVLLMLLSIGAYGQSVDGDTSMDQGQTKSYTLIGSNLTNINWGVSSGGSLESTNGGYNMDVKAVTGANITISVTYSQSGGSGPGGTGLTVLVRPGLPDEITANYANCAVTLSKGQAPTGVTWYWQTSINGTSQSATASAETYTPTSSGTYYLRARSNGTDGQWSQSSRGKTVTMPSPPGVPSVSGNNPREICANQSTTMSISGADPGFTYKWYEGSTYLGGDGTSKTVSPSSSSVYTVTATNPEGCVSAPRTITVNVLDLPQPLANHGNNDCTSTDIVVSVNNTKTVNGTVRNDMTHVWYRNSNRTNPITAQTVPDTPSGTLATQITVTDQTNTSFWVATKIGGCESALTRVDATFVNFSLNPGGIGGADTICYNTDPNNLTSTSAASGGNQSYTYEWQYANSQNGVYYDIANTNAPTYNPGSNLTADRWYRRKVTSCNGDSVAYSNKVKITVYPPLSGGGSIQASDTSAICYDTDPGIINSTALPTGGSAHTYEWQYASSENGTYTPISNTNVESYNPGTNLTAPRWYRRKTTSCGQTTYSNKILIDVEDALTNGGTISTPPPVCFNGDPGVIGNSALPTGGGNPTYQWQYSSSENGTYTAITNSDTESYDPANLTASRWYRRRVTACGQTLFSNSIQVIVYPALTSGGTLAAPDPICYNADPATIASTGPAVGGNGHTYQWEYSDTQNGNYTAIPNSDVEAYDPSNLTASRWYRRRVSSCGQEQLSNSVQLVVVPVLTAPVADDEVFYCSTGPVAITVTKDANADSARWYTTATGGTHFHEGDTYDAPAQNATFYVASHSTAGCESAQRKQILVSLATDITWSLDADNDGYAQQQQQSCESPGAGWVPEDRPLGDCDDTDANITVPKIWYVDLDENGQGDGLGDPSMPSELLCVAPAGYVDNADDLCPNHISPTNDCYFTPTDCNPSGTAPSGQRSRHNYVYSRTYQKEVDNIPAAKFANDDGYIQQITYFDGLGRPIQENAIRQSPDGDDIIVHMDYDSHGRMTKDWLPVPEGQQLPGRFKTGDIEGLIKSYYGTNYSEDFTGMSQNDQNPYSEKRFEASPLNRVTQQAAPGKDWKLDNGHDIGFDYLANTVADAVKRFDVTLTPLGETYVPALNTGSDYLPGELRKTITQDENHTGANKNHTTEEFTDKQGRVVLKRTYADVTQPSGAVSVAEAHDTYYVYDDFGNLTYVLPPKMNGGTAHLNDLGYQYVYDYRNRLVEKKIPGKGWEYIVYNNLDQPILTQDANQRAKSPDEWLYTKYDNQGRVAYTGKATAPDGTTRTTVQNEVAALTIALWVDRTDTDRNTEFVEDVPIFYTNGAYPDDSSTVSLSEVLTINYYDTYADHGTNVPTQITPLGETTAIDATANNVRGLATGSRVKVLDQSPSKWITTVSYYDAKGRPIYTHSTNDFLETVDIMETELDFIGRVRKSRSSHTRTLSGAEATIVTIDNFAYDHTGRLVAQTQCVGDASLGTSCGGGSGGSNVPATETLTGTVNGTVVASDHIEVLPVATLDPGTELIISNVTIDSGGDQELIVYNDYDEIGQLRYKKVGGDPNFTRLEDSPGLQRVDYAYNVRGWLKTINNDAVDDNDLFDFEIRYNDPQGWGEALYNGNISQTAWSSMSVNPPNTNGQFNDVSTGYTYSYDALNRIIGARDDTGNYNLGGYNVSGDLTQPVTYDKNGNIETLYRTGHTVTNQTAFGAMDDLSYVYDNGNQLQSVTDMATGTGFSDGNSNGVDYDYDDNGNMTQDLNKGIQAGGITYNHLNLPTSVVVNGTENGTITYIYDATGVKLRKNVLENSNTTSTEYAGSFVYKTAGGNTTLEFFGTPEGYVEPKNASNLSQGFDYIYQYEDHLGNVRLSYTDSDGDGTIDLNDINGTDLDGDGDAANEIVEENNYYPFGLKHGGYNLVMNSTNVAQDFKYNGVELEGSLGLNLYEMPLRNYNPSIARWTGIDPVTHHSMSTYNAFDNNPVFWSDPSGANSWTYIDGSYLNNVTGETTDDWRRAVSETVSGKEESTGPKDDITVNSKGIVTNVIRKKGKPNRFFDEDGNELILNDPEFDKIYFEGKWSKGDQVFQTINDQKMVEYLFEAGLSRESKLVFYNIGLSYFLTSIDSHTSADFAFNYLRKDLDNINLNNDYGDEYTYVRIGKTNRIYNIPDAGNFLWGAWMNLNGYGLRESTIGAQVNSILTLNGIDTEADQNAIKAGYNYFPSVIQNKKDENDK